jgi:hypothetical protein
MKMPVMKADGMSRAKIERLAQKVLTDFCRPATQNLIALDVENLFEQYLPKRFRIETGYEKMSPNIHGYTQPSKLRSFVSVDLVQATDRATARFARSTIGHESGHAILHAHQFKFKRCEATFLHDKEHANDKLFRQEELKPYENPEWQAWEFCKSLLLPERLARQAVDDGLSAQEIAEIIDVNTKFVEVRLANLHLT